MSLFAKLRGVFESLTGARACSSSAFCDKERLGCELEHGHPGNHRARNPVKGSLLEWSNEQSADALLERSRAEQVELASAYRERSSSPAQQRGSGIRVRGLAEAARKAAAR